MKISREEVLHVAHLARLNIGDGEIDPLCGQLGSILEYVEKLSGIDTSAVAPTAHAMEMANAFRKDETGRHLENQQALANGPDAEAGHFIVPKVIE
ncbi:MAG TPA: Asp-tRNA(Asn)/Glu-tRNA(Gln) amidotransferase subunit GatC [Desulfosalsimonadaceae bacterium]|nr:Asp-tRNA(Asn)/Glu-tRNA(Gln) amidotransferase subunit GatC [Desulfosalsimonadaceae bacterium]